MDIVSIVTSSPDDEKELFVQLNKDGINLVQVWTKHRVLNNLMPLMNPPVVRVHPAPRSIGCQTTIAK